MHATPSKMGTGVNILEKNLWGGSENFDFGGAGFVMGEEVNFSGGGVREFSRKMKNCIITV